MDTLQFKIEHNGEVHNIIARPVQIGEGLQKSTGYIVEIDKESARLFTFDSEYMTLMADKPFNEELEIRIGRAIDRHHA